jgi:riboflavin synthase
MFTGLIEEVGRIRDPRPLENGRAFRIEARAVLEGLAPGDSVAVDGVCLTVTQLGADHFDVQAVATTLERTTLGGYLDGRRVNLERAMKLGDRLGGHLVQGHVDGVGSVRRVTPQGELVLIEVEMPEEVAGVTVLHGSIAINGVSLTVNELPAPGVVGLSIIPFTWSHTAFTELRVDDPVNVEGDLIGKYVRQLLGRPEGSADLLRGWGY